MSFTASFTAYQRVGTSRRASEHGGLEQRRPTDACGEGTDMVDEGAATGGEPSAA